MVPTNCKLEPKSYTVLRFWFRFMNRLWLEPPIEAWVVACWSRKLWVSVPYQNRMIGFNFGSILTIHDSVQIKPWSYLRLTSYAPYFGRKNTELKKQKIVQSPQFNELNTCFIMKRFLPGKDPKTIFLIHAEFWIQIHSLRTSFRSKTVVYAIGSFLGTMYNRMRETSMARCELSTGFV